MALAYSSPRSSARMCIGPAPLFTPTTYTTTTTTNHQPAPLRTSPAGGPYGGSLPQHEPGRLAAQVRRAQQQQPVGPTSLRPHPHAASLPWPDAAAAAAEAAPACRPAGMACRPLPRSIPPFPPAATHPSPRRFNDLQQRHARVSRELEALEVSLARESRAAAGAPQAAELTPAQQQMMELSKVCEEVWGG